MRRHGWLGRQVLGALGGAVVWVLLWGNVSVANVVAGFLLSLLIVVVFPLPPLTVGVRVRPLRLLRLVVRFAYDVIRASLHVSWLAFRPQRPPRSSVVTTQLTTRNQLFQTIVGEMLSLVPGSLVVDIDGEAGLISLHVLDVGTPAQAAQHRADVLALEQRVLAALAADPLGRIGTEVDE
ncbi:MAG TPA: Na+/H+ antiporter subunit E [Actinomycetales bacterium]|nr:Na+/H+ antiporter subunit E [Actinomycetales bacterium]